MLTGNLSKHDHECITARCWCLFELKHDGVIVACCPSPEAHKAAWRLLGMR